MVLKNKPEIRFTNFKNDWVHQSLNKVVERVIRKNKNNESKVPLTISAQYGLVDQVTYFNKQIASTDLSNYFLLQKGDFAYNKSYSKDYPWGAIKRLDKYEEGVLSSLYIVFKPTRVHSDFLVSYYETSRWYKEVSMRATEGARNHGLLNISAVDFLETELSIPVDFEEQMKIGKFFRDLDDTISLHQQELEALKQTKQGFLQKMFPKDGEIFPEVRFKNFVESWREVSLGAISDSYSGGTPSAGNKQYYNGTIPFIRSAEINSSTTELFLTEEGLSNSSAKLVQKGTILYAMYGATSGEVGISRIDGAINQAILAIKPKEEYDIQFLYQYLKKSKKSIVNSYLQGGQGNLSGAIIKKVPIWLPENREEQIKIGEFFRQLDEVIELKEKELEVLMETKKGFLQKMFV
ncbi:MAG: restriction endonuclease subunit S [Exiguobacterium sp.]|nr:restriction endonuclease subunit S [Exiguobacterium sp.]MBR3216870.1 restriction endonuclease subunit S [Exiguobacterium sp.]